MKNTVMKSKLKSLMPYFIFGVAIIIVFRLSDEFNLFRDALSWIWGVFAPFFYGFLIAYILNIPIGAMRRLLLRSKRRFINKRARMFATIIIVLILLAIIALTLNFVIPAIVNSITFFVVNIPVYIDGTLLFIEQFNEYAPFGWHISTETMMESLGNVFSMITVDTLMSPINAIMDLATGVFTAVIAIISSIYILHSKDKMKEGAHRFLKVCMSKNVYNASIEHLNQLNLNFRTYIRTQTIDGAILGTLATIQLLIIGSPYALVLGIMLGVVNYVPYFGSIFGTLIAVLVVLLTQGFTMGLIIAITLLITQQIDANVIQPKLMSGSFSLNPLLVIIGISVGGAVAGIMGMIVAIPIIALLKDIYDIIVKHYEQKKLEKAENAETE